MPERRRGPAESVRSTNPKIAKLRRSRARLQQPATPAAESEVPTPVSAEAKPRSLWGTLARPGRGQVLAAVMLFLLGLGGVMQIRSNTADAAYATARREDLVVLLDGLGEQSRRLEAEIADLERTRTNLRSGADTQRVAHEEAQKRADELAVLAGTVPASGPGIRMRISDPAHLVGAELLLDAVEEMRDAGAEVIEINDTVRVVASSSFGIDNRGLVVDGIAISDPIMIEVIGEPHALEEGARFRGGIVSEITGPRIGGQVDLEQVDHLVVASLHTPRDNQYAQPASPTTR